MDDVLKNYTDSFRKFKDWKGSTSQKEYWTFIAISIATQIFVPLILILISSSLPALGKPTLILAFLVIASIFASAFLFAQYLSTVAICIRRLRDAKQSPWFALAISPLVAIIPGIGPLVYLAALIVFGCLPSANSTSNEKIARQTTSTPAGTDALTQIEKIAALKASGALNEDEFADMKRKILAA